MDCNNGWRGVRFLSPRKDDISNACNTQHTQHTPPLEHAQSSSSTSFVATCTIGSTSSLLLLLLLLIHTSFALSRHLLSSVDRDNDSYLRIARRTIVFVGANFQPLWFAPIHCLSLSHSSLFSRNESYTSSAVRTAFRELPSQSTRGR